MYTSECTLIILMGRFDLRCKDVTYICYLQHTPLFYLCELSNLNNFGPLYVILELLQSPPAMQEFHSND